MKQYVCCIGLLQKEICRPIYMEWLGDDKIDVYSYVLMSASIMVLTLASQQMDACIVYLMRSMNETRSSLVTLFISDLFAFVSRVAATSFTLELIKGILHIMGNMFQRNDMQHLSNILIVTCGRLMKEISANDKVELLYRYPIRRYFRFWSCFPPSAFLDQPDTIQQLWNESLSTLQELTAGCPKSSASATFILGRLPLALQCLISLVTLSDTNEFQHPELHRWHQKLKNQFMPVYRIVMVMHKGTDLPLIRTSLCLLLKLGSLPQFGLPDTDMPEIVKGTVQRFDDRTIFGAASFIAALGRQIRLPGTSLRIIPTFFAHYCLSHDLRVKNCATMALLEFSSWTSCEKLIQECGKSIDLEYSRKILENQTGGTFIGSSYPTEYDNLFDMDGAV